MMTTLQGPKHDSRRASRLLLAIAAATGSFFALALSLWGYYGTDVFFEMVRAGWIACF